MRALFLLLGLAITAGVVSQVVEDDHIMFRGDANMDGDLNISDPIYISNWLFSIGPEPGCLNQADANNDGSVETSDIAYLYCYLFDGGPPPPTPGDGTECTFDDYPYPGCKVYPCD